MRTTTDHSIETATGRFFNFEQPDPDTVDLQDIACGLANTCRFGGHTSSFYSVAQHAVLVYDLVREWVSPELALAALHHDSHEAYVGDIPTPLKKLLGASYRVYVKLADDALAAWLGIPPALFRHNIIKSADAMAMRLEAAVLKKSRGLGPHWGQEELPCIDVEIRPKRAGRAETEFILAHHRASRAFAEARCNQQP